MGDRLHSGYQAELASFRLAFSRTGCMVALLLVAAGASLDLIFYPEQAAMLGFVRGATTVLLSAVLGLLYTRAAIRYVLGLTLVWLALPQAMISWMIYATQGAASPYVFGLSLAMYAAGIVLPIGVLQSVGLGVFTCAAYIVAGLLHAQTLLPSPELIGNTIFLLFSATISAVCTFYNERARIRLFALQHEVRQKNIQLQQTNQALAEIKGLLVQREKMAALGTLSAGLLHEVNNPVNYSMMALDMALMDPATAASADLKESLDDAKEGMQRVQNIVSDLKTFAYQQPGGDSMRVFLFEKTVQAARRLTGHELKGLDVQTDLPLDSHVVGDDPAIIGVLINLLSNAALALRTCAKQHPERLLAIRVSAVREARRLRVRVRDNGTGIAPDNLSRVFEPFFTTRDVGQGLGLGLSVCYAIVQRHGGQLVVESELGEWTEFSFDLQLANIDEPAHQDADPDEKAQA